MKVLFFVILVFMISYCSSSQQTETLRIRNNWFKAHLDLSGFFLLNGKSDTVLKFGPNCFVNYQFKDFNKDGYKDLCLEWAGNKGGNYGGTYSVCAFDTATNAFKEIKNFENYPDAQQIKGSKYYYSYQRIGCSDQTWISDLFYIQNNATIKAGTIQGDGCGVNDGIYIYKMKKGRKKLFQSLPLETVFNYENNKWRFIKKYWSKNYKRFSG